MSPSIITTCVPFLRLGLPSKNIIGFSHFVCPFVLHKTQLKSEAENRFTTRLWKRNSSKKSAQLIKGCTTRFTRITCAYYLPMTHFLCILQWGISCCASGALPAIKGQHPWPHPFVCSPGFSKKRRLLQSDDRWSLSGFSSCEPCCLHLQQPPRYLLPLLKNNLKNHVHNLTCTTSQVWTNLLRQFVNLYDFLHCRLTLKSLNIWESYM